MIDFASRKHNIKKNIEMSAHEGMSIYSGGILGSSIQHVESMEPKCSDFDDDDPEYNGDLP